MRDYYIEWIEQPVAAGDIGGMAAVRAAVDVPTMADESCQSPADALRIVQAQAADILNIKLMKSGGIVRAREMPAIARAGGLPCIVGSMIESSIASAAGLHLAVSDLNIIACELIGPISVRNDPAEGYAVDADTGIASVMDAPGLGVRLRAGGG